MTILDTFYTVFKSTGSEKVVKDQKSVDDSLKKMKQDFDDVDNASNKVTQSFGKLGGELVKGASKALLMIGALSRLKDATQYAIHLDIASQQLGVNTEELDAWGRAVERTGGNVDTFKSTLMQFAQNLGTNGATALKVLPQFADTFQKLGQFGAMKYGKTIGLDEPTILLLQKGSMELDRIIKRQTELGVVTKKDAEAARTFNDEWLNVTQSLQIAFLEIVTEMLPSLIKIANFAVESIQYLRKHIDFLIGTLGGLAIVLGGIFKRFSLITIAATILSIAIGAVYEDIKAFVNGTDSLIGRLLARFPLLRKEVEAFVTLAKDLKNAASWLYKSADKESALLNNRFGLPLTESQKNILLEHNIKINPKSGIIPNQPSVPSALPLSNSTIQKLKAFNSSNLTLNADNIEKLKASKDFLKIAGNSPINNQVSTINNAAGNKTYNFSIGDINIHTQASDINSFAQSIDASFKEQLRQVLYNFDDGVQG